MWNNILYNREGARPARRLCKVIPGLADRNKTVMIVGACRAPARTTHGPSRPPLAQARQDEFIA